MAADLAASDAARILENLDVGVMIQDASTKIVYANAAALAQLGLRRDELVGVTTSDPIWNVVHPDGRAYPAETRPVAVSIRTKRPVRDAIMGVYRSRTADRVWLQVSALPELDDTGEVLRVLTTFKDISAAQQALLSTESLYQAVIRSMSEGVVIHEQDSSIRMANPAAERILGLSVEQLAGRTPLDPRWRLLLPNGKPPQPDQIPSEITRKTGKPVRGTLLSVHRPNGEQAWLSVSTNPFDEGGPEGYGTVATFTDVTAEREAKLALEQSQQQLTSVLNVLPGVVFQSVRTDDGEDYFEFITARAPDVFGVSVEAAVKDAGAVWGRVHPDDLGSLRAAASESAKGPSAWEGEFRVRRSEGEYAWVRIQANPQRLEHGVRWTGLAVDVTEARNLAEQLRRSQQREAMADLAAGVAHNFNNMLAAILPNVEMAQADAPQANRELLEDASRAAQNAADLVRQLMSLSRPGASDDATTLVDLVPLVMEAIKICRRTFDRAIAISENIAVSSVSVRGRASGLQQVVLNLCLNARDALAEASSPQLHVSLDIEAGPIPNGVDCAEHVVLTVTDNGCGMDEEALRHVGEPFFTTKEPGRGTGLGLATAFRTVADSAGTLVIDSEVGKGTTFCIRLPVAARDSRVDRVAAVSVSHQYSGRVLIVDDEVLVRRVLSRMVATLGMEAVELDRGDEVVAKVEQLITERERLNAVVLDLSLPGLSGAEALVALRERRPDLPVLVLSGHVAEGADLSLATRVLQKPVTVSELRDALSEIIAADSGR